MKRPFRSPVTPSRAGACSGNGVLLFEDTGELLPDGRVIAPHRSRLIAA